VNGRFQDRGPVSTSIATLDPREGSFFDHRDPEKVKWLGTRKL
jgi:hypothetical protein